MEIRTDCWRMCCTCGGDGPLELLGISIGGVLDILSFSRNLQESLYAYPVMLCHCVAFDGVRSGTMAYVS